MSETPSPFKKHFCGFVYGTVGSTESKGRFSVVTQRSVCGFTLLQVPQICSFMGKYPHNSKGHWSPTVACAAFGHQGLDVGGACPGGGSGCNKSWCCWKAMKMVEESQVTMSLREA